MAERGEDGFLERWSRRKRGDSDLGAPETEVVEAPPLEEEEPDSGDPEVIAKLPDLDSLTEDTDFTAFLQEGVPEALRRKALRRLWRLNPVFANLDGLNDYDEDFSALGIIAENIKTMYKVGKGYLDEDDDESGDESETEAEDEIAESDTRDTEAIAEPESQADSDPKAPESGDSLETARAGKVDPVPNSEESESDESESGESEPESAAARDFESKSEFPARGSALARRWGGSPNKG